MKRVILVLVIAAVVVVMTVKLWQRQPEPQSTPATTASSARVRDKRVLYLFHDPSDQDAGCRRIYAYADQAEKELTENVEVRRPDIEREGELIEQFQVRVLPTILIVSSTGAVEGRFEGEDSSTAARIEQALERLKETPQ